LISRKIIRSFLILFLPTDNKIFAEYPADSEGRCIPDRPSFTANNFEAEKERFFPEKRSPEPPARCGIAGTKRPNQEMISRGHG
jgi:hypothetical protein